MYKKRIIDIRDNNNLKQYEVAKILNIAPTTYNNYENEYEIIPLKHLNDFCNYFNTSFDYIFNFSDLILQKNAKKNINATISGQRLKSIRKENNLTQKQLASFLNLDQTAISKYELGKSIMPTLYLYTICQKYKISADYLLGRVDKPKYLK